MSIYCLDTSAVLAGAIKSYDTICISPVVLQELEHIKTHSQNEDLKYRVREAVRDIISSTKVFHAVQPQWKVKWELKKYSFLSDINDHRILCETLLTVKQQANNAQAVYFVTADATQHLFANRIGLNTIYLNRIEKQEEPEYCGWGKYYPTEQEMALLYSDPQMNTLKAKTNEFCEVYEGKELKDVLYWTGEVYRPLKYKEIHNDFIGQTIRPRNLEQKMAFDLLQNTNVPVKLLFGSPGSGKDYLMFLHAWDQVQRGKKQKIIFVRNLVPFKDAPEIGFLQGSLHDKISWGLGPIESILGEEGLQMAEQTGQIEAVNLGFIRGCSYDDSIIYVSEGQNITGGGYKLLISRCGNNSELWVNGDILQTDDKKFEKNNGINRLIHSLTGDKLFGTVKLIKTERSAVADLASKI